MAIRVAINGFGRIGRVVTRVMLARDDFEIVQINDLTTPQTLAHLFKYDSVHGRYSEPVGAGEGHLTIGNRKITVSAERDPKSLPWGDLGIDFVVESTGVFAKREQVGWHLEAGAKKALLTVPAKDEIDATIVMGVNQDTLKSSDKIISNASCTTNCLAPLAKVLHSSFGLQRGLVTTVHAYTNDQHVLDLPHKDLRRARAAAQNIIPTTTGAARAVGKVIPELNGKLDGMAMRVPVPDGSVVDLVAILDKHASVEDINAAFKAAAEGPMKGILEYCTDPIVSCDIIGNPHSSIFDQPLTMVSDHLVKVVSWYDNEFGYSNRVVDLIAFAHGLGE
ncbi:MAG: type I glyceraldehyde-3-phosphate dehydrogenase [Planctomycetota bacterium]